MHPSVLGNLCFILDELTGDMPVVCISLRGEKAPVFGLSQHIARGPAGLQSYICDVSHCARKRVGRTRRGTHSAAPSLPSSSPEAQFSGDLGRALFFDARVSVLCMEIFFLNYRK